MGLFTRIAIAVAVLALFLFLSHPHELRRTRWIKIAASIPLCYLLYAVGGFAFGFLLTMLAIIWAPNIAWFASGALVGLIHGTSNVNSGPQDFRMGRSYLRDGNFTKAIEVTVVELQKDPTSYEGNMLAAQLYEEVEQPEPAIEAMERVLNNPGATELQKDSAAQQLEICKQLKERLDRANPKRKIPKSKIRQP